MFGLESFVARDIRRLGYETDAVTDGRVSFFGDFSAVARANLNLREGERVLIEVANFQALTFDELFEGTKAADWARFIPKDGAFPVTGHALKSRLFSVPDCQSIVKKAVVDKLRQTHRVEWFAETGPKFPIEFFLFHDRVSLLLDTSGEGLHKRGYRENANMAPLRETLASAIVKTARFFPDVNFYDPMCGSGTIAIEAALLGANIAPGLRRSFLVEQWPCFDRALMRAAREEALSAIRRADFVVHASDIDPAMAELTKKNAALAGVSHHVEATVCDVKHFRPAAERGVIACNPPYGERMLERSEAQALARVMGRAFSALPGFNCYIITSDEEFEKHFGRRATKKRKMYNGMIKCDLYQYFTPRERR
nr:class I SAM-dependent RNA methyltransferase [Feifania hominis]